ncbi:MAG TPA: hypothetical protein PLC89_27420 [Haliscomenobacter sp.]|uniref:hypothetical protein n=1 Tax=Haliscomenobacter sp. TaxID=2717303 RepID=UPI002CC643BB|nr:hypothetical protein [Haliscomenobacter sp.]HOY21073.1 hypothetical protein [Haliscomenobacter sp.]
MKTKYFMLGLCFALTPLFLMAQTTAGLNYQVCPERQFFHPGLGQQWASSESCCVGGRKLKGLYL